MELKESRMEKEQRMDANVMEMQIEMLTDKKTFEVVVVCYQKVSMHHIDVTSYLQQNEHYIYD